MSKIPGASEFFQVALHADQHRLPQPEILIITKHSINSHRGDLRIGKEVKFE